ncbi:MAG: c-type cytochrome biogenesis protein CcmI [Gemmatimonadales bacterium]
MVELIAGILLAAAAVSFVILPVLRPPAADDADSGDGADSEEDVSPRAVALRALKEIEFDRATGKLSDADYESLKAKYTAEALAALRESAPSAVHRAPEPPSRAPRAAHGAPCPVHGPRPESDAEFCSVCGRRLAAAPGFCIRCGTALAADARYCDHCGARVAA